MQNRDVIHYVDNDAARHSSPAWSTQVSISALPPSGASSDSPEPSPEASSDSVGNEVAGAVVGDSVGVRVGHHSGTCCPTASAASSSGTNAAARSCRDSGGIFQLESFLGPLFDNAPRIKR